MPSTAKRHDVADLALAEAGQARIQWADDQMPVLRAIRARFERERPLAGMRVAACLHVTAETANLVRALLAAGAEAALCASNPLSTQDEVAAALADRHGAEVHAVHGEDAEAHRRHIEAVLDPGPRITMDDGADLASALHAAGGDRLTDVVGGTEETTTGALRLRALEAEGRLAFPVVAVSAARTKRLLDNRHGTGQSTLDGILRATNVLLAGRVVVVVGYGWCGKGVASRARGAGAQVVVCEIDPMRALEATMDGLRVMPALEAARVGDVFITATGGRDALAGPHFDLMRDGAIVCNAGHFDVELNLPDLRARARSSRRVRPHVEQLELADGRRLNLLADGRIVNLAAAEGHPAAVMDVSFAIQALAVEHLARHGGELEPRVQDVPEAIDCEIARLKLASLGVEIDALTDVQRAYLHAWEPGA